MQITKSEKFVKAEDIAKAKGVIFKILDEPKLNDGKFGAKVETRMMYSIDNVKIVAKWGMNDTTRDLLIDRFGKETADWIGKDIKVHTELINGKESIMVDKV